MVYPKVLSPPNLIIKALHAQVELRQTVSLHLRARRTGGSLQGTAAFVRLFSRLSSMLSGRVADANLASLGDVIADSSGLDLSAQIDAVVQDQIAALGRLASAVKVALADQADTCPKKAVECLCLDLDFFAAAHRKQWITMAVWIF